MLKEKRTAQSSQPGLKENETKKQDIDNSICPGSNQLNLVQSFPTDDTKHTNNQEIEALIEDVWSLNTDQVESLNTGRSTLHDIHADIVDKTKDEIMLATQSTDIDTIAAPVVTNPSQKKRRRRNKR
eukprot:GFUD01074127.1.p1 GENE.GFUD01074127.1~~GFUD01074127.1.p1  ORF type:complete len:127 (+),score=38.32 GFUD01074127.1:32-412(+)